MNNNASPYIEKSSLKNLKLITLEKEIKQNNAEALLKFWSSIEKVGMPLIEEFSQDNQYSLVTFIYKADKEIENVIFIPPVDWENFINYKMERLLDTNLWYVTCKVKNNLRFTYHFSVNDTFGDDWEKREERLIYDRFNRNYLIFGGENNEKIEKISYIVMPKSEKFFWVKEKHVTDKGKLTQDSFKSERLENKIQLSVYTPHGYEKFNEPYKFLIVTDGKDYIGNLSAKAVLDNLIAYKKIPPIVVLFIDSDDSRYENLTCNDDYVNIIVEELIPWWRKNYNISTKAVDGIIGGFSLGGLTAAYIGLRHSEVFGNVLSQSGSFWYKPQDCEKPESDCWISSQFKNKEKLPLKFYLNVGVLEPKDNMIEANKKLRNVLLSKGYEVNYEEFNSGHDYLCWGETFAKGLISLIGIHAGVKGSK